MAKRQKRNRRERRTLPSIRPLVPSAATVFRLYLKGPSAHELIGATLSEARPEMVARARAAVEKIERAVTADELLDLAPVAVGFSRNAWRQRAQDFGPEIAPLISQRLRDLSDLPDKEGQSAAKENLLGALGFLGDAGTKAVLACFDDLDDYAKSLACAVLGHLGAVQAADDIWDFYQKVRKNRRESFFVGALWGLVDLDDPRAADALDKLIWGERFFYEAFAMAYKVGDARLLIPLMAASDVSGGPLKESAVWALVGLAHRVGRDALLAELQPAELEAGKAPPDYFMVDDIFAMSSDAADAYFSVFFQGLTSDMIDLDDVDDKLEALDRLQPWIDGGDQLLQEPPPPGQRPGRNDPCWCGSGEKYKYCHWRQDREGAD
jgi:hypothetical protein